MALKDMIVKTINKTYFTEEFMRIVDDHTGYLAIQSSTQVIQVDPHDADVYTFDLYGYLLSRGIRNEMFYTILKLNKMSSPTDFDLNTKQLMIPDPGELSVLMQAYNASLGAAI